MFYFLSCSKSDCDSCSLHTSEKLFQATSDAVPFPCSTLQRWHTETLFHLFLSRMYLCPLYSLLPDREQHLTHPIQSQGAVWSMNQAAIADRVSRRSHVYQTLFFFSFRVWLHGLNTYPLQTSILLGNELFTNWHGLRLHLVSSDNMTLILVVASQCHTLCNMIVLFLSSYLPQSPLGIVVLHWGRRGLGSPGSLTHSRRSVREL